MDFLFGGDGGGAQQLRVELERSQALVKILQSINNEMAEKQRENVALAIAEVKRNWREEVAGLKEQVQHLEILLEAVHAKACNHAPSAMAPNGTDERITKAVVEAECQTTCQGTCAQGTQCDHAAQVESQVEAATQQACAEAATKADAEHAALESAAALAASEAAAADAAARAREASSLQTSNDELRATIAGLEATIDALRSELSANQTEASKAMAEWTASRAQAEALAASNAETRKALADSAAARAQLDTRARKASKECDAAKARADELAGNLTSCKLDMTRMQNKLWETERRCLDQQQRVLALQTAASRCLDNGECFHCAPEVRSAPAPDGRQLNADVRAEAGSNCAHCRDLTKSVLYLITTLGDAEADYARVAEQAADLAEHEGHLVEWHDELSERQAAMCAKEADVDARNAAWLCKLTQLSEAKHSFECRWRAEVERVERREAAVQMAAGGSDAAHNDEAALECALSQVLDMWPSTPCTVLSPVQTDGGGDASSVEGGGDGKSPHAVVRPDSSQQALLG